GETEPGREEIGKRHRRRDGDRDRPRWRPCRKFAYGGPCSFYDHLPSSYLLSLLDASGPALRRRSLLHHVEGRDSVRLGHGREIENLFNKEIGACPGSQCRLAQVHEFGGTLAYDLYTEHARAAALAEQRQESDRF